MNEIRATPAANPIPSPARDPLEQAMLNDGVLELRAGVPLDGEGHVESLGEWCDCVRCLRYREAMREAEAKLAPLDRLDALAGLNPQACGADADGSFGYGEILGVPGWQNGSAIGEPYEAPLTVAEEGALPGRAPAQVIDLAAARLKAMPLLPERDEIENPLFLGDFRGQVPQLTFRERVDRWALKHRAWLLFWCWCALFAAGLAWLVRS